MRLYRRRRRVGVSRGYPRVESVIGIDHHRSLPHNKSHRQTACQHSKNQCFVEFFHGLPRSDPTFYNAYSAGSRPPRNKPHRVREGVVGQGTDERRSFTQVCGTGALPSESVLGGGATFTGPMLTSCTSTCSSPVTTLPPWLPPVFTLPFVELVMPPAGACGSTTRGVIGATIVGTSSRVIVRSDARTSACAKSTGKLAKTNVTSRIIAPSCEIDVFIIFF